MDQPPHQEVAGFTNLFKADNPKDKKLKEGEYIQVTDLVQDAINTRLTPVERQLEALSNELHTEILNIKRKHTALADFCQQIHNLDLAMITDIAVVRKLIQDLQASGVLQHEYPMPPSRVPIVTPIKLAPSPSAPPY